MEVARFAKKPIILDEEPNLALEHMIDLLGRMGMRCRVISGCAHGVHQAAFGAVGALDDHGTFALFARAHDLAVRNVFSFAMERHAVTFRLRINPSPVCISLWARSQPRCHRERGT
jgi:hypothetical protein